MTLDLAVVMAQIEALPEFQAAERAPQDPRRHPEGSVGRHLRLVRDAALRLADLNDVDPAGRAVLALVALTHDLGKVEQHARSGGANVHNHEAVSARILGAFLRRHSLPDPVERTALEIVELHDRGVALYHSRPVPGPTAFGRLARRLSAPTLYALFTIADRLGSNGNLTVPAWLIEHLRAAGCAIPPLRLPDGGSI